MEFLNHWFSIFCVVCLFALVTVFFLNVWLINKMHNEYIRYPRLRSREELREKIRQIKQKKNKTTLEKQRGVKGKDKANSTPWDKSYKPMEDVDTSRPPGWDGGSGRTDMDKQTEHNNLMLALRITLSPHEWEWTQKEQEAMARYVLHLVQQYEQLMSERDELVETVEYLVLWQDAIEVEQEKQIGKLCISFQGRNELVEILDNAIDRAVQGARVYLQGKQEIKHDNFE